MLSQLTIPNARNTGPELDYQRLFQVGVKHVQALANRIWTDYNVHDPGATTLELLCYAITDLTYRASLPIQDLLAGGDHSTFFTADAILPSRPLTQLDYRKLLIDLPKVQNAWLRPASLCYYADTLRGELFGPALLLLGEINLPKLAARLKTADPISKYATPRLSDESRQALAAYNGAGDSPELQARLVRDLNVIIQGENIYEPSRFAGVALATPTATLLNQNPQGNALARLNRLLLEDAFPQELLRNAPLRDRAAGPGIEEVNLQGLYDVILEFADNVTSPADKAKIVGQARALLHDNRNLGEDFVSFSEVRTQPFLLCCEVELAPGADVPSVQAEILFQVDQYLSPPIRRYSLSDRLARKKPDGSGFGMDDIFDGPLLSHGFIDDEELKQAELRTEVFLSEVISIIMDIPGVSAVKDIVINPEDASIPAPDKWVVPVLPQTQATLNWQKSRIVAYKRHQPMPIDRAAIKALYEAKVKEAQAALADLGKSKFLDDLARLVSIPTGNPAGLGSYYSFQNHFPQIYGLSDVGLSRSGLSEADYTKRADQARQLKAYLLFFDQLMANYCAQLSSVRGLFSSDAGLQRTYYSQVVNSFAEWASIYSPADPAAELQKITENRAAFVERRNRFLDHLISRFAERFADFGNIILTVLKGKQADLIDPKCEFLEHYPELSRDRALACNYTLKTEAELWNTKKVSGLEKRVCGVLGLKNFARRNLADAAEEGMYLIETILLRAEQAGDMLLPICPNPNSAEWARKDPYSYRIHIILPAYIGRFSNMDFRRFAEEVIRQETPAHLPPRICWISREDMASLQDKYHAWLALKAGATNADRAMTLSNFIGQLFAVRNVYPKQALHECAAGETVDKFLLGQTSLGTMKP